MITVSGANGEGVEIRNVGDQRALVAKIPPMGASHEPKNINSFWIKVRRRLKVGDALYRRFRDIHTSTERRFRINLPRYLGMLRSCILTREGRELG